MLQAAIFRSIVTTNIAWYMIGNTLVTAPIAHKVGFFVLFVFGCVVEGLKKIHGYFTRYSSVGQCFYTNQ